MWGELLAVGRMEVSEQGDSENGARGWQRRCDFKNKIWRSWNMYRSVQCHTIQSRYNDIWHIVISIFIYLFIIIYLKLYLNTLTPST